MKRNNGKCYPSGVTATAEMAHSSVGETERSVESAEMAHSSVRETERSVESAEMTHSSMRETVRSVESAEMTHSSMREVLSITEDLLKMKKFQETELSCLIKSMQTSPESNTYRRLQELVLSLIIIFNQRGGGESARLLLETYVNRSNWGNSASAEILKSLKPLECELIKR